MGGRLCVGVVGWLLLVVAVCSMALVAASAVGAVRRTRSAQLVSLLVLSSLFAFTISCMLAACDKEWVAASRCSLHTRLGRLAHVSVAAVVACLLEEAVAAC